MQKWFFPLLFLPFLAGGPIPSSSQSPAKPCIIDLQAGPDGVSLNPFQCGMSFVPNLVKFMPQAPAADDRSAQAETVPANTEPQARSSSYMPGKRYLSYLEIGPTSGERPCQPAKPAVRQLKLVPSCVNATQAMPLVKQCDGRWPVIGISVVCYENLKMEGEPIGLFDQLREIMFGSSRVMEALSGPQAFTVKDESGKGLASYIPVPEAPYFICILWRDFEAFASMRVRVNGVSSLPE